MTTAYEIFHLPRELVIDSSVRVVPGAKLYFFATGTSTPQDTYTDSALTIPSANPVIADANGLFATIYLNPFLIYKATLTTAADVLIYTQDPVNDQFLSQAIIGAYLYPQTAAEIAAGVTPTAYYYPPYNVRRYGAALNATWNGTIATGTDDTVAFTNAIKAASAGGGGSVTFDGPTIIKNVPLLSYVNIYGIGNAANYLNPTAAGDVHFNAQGTPGTAVPVTNNIAVGGSVANVANTSTFSAGMYAVIQTTGTSVPTDYVFYGGAATYPTSNGRKQQIVRIESLVANTSLTFDTGVFESYTGGSCQICPLPPVTYANATGAIIGFGIFNTNAQVAIGNNGGGIQVWYGIDFKVQGNTITGASGYPGIRTIQSSRGDISLNFIRDCQQVGAGLSTGIAHDIIESSSYISVHHNKLTYLTEDEVGMRVTHCQFSYNEYLNAFDSGINTHGNSCSHIDITDNDIICPNAPSGIAVGYSANRTQDSYITIARNRIVNSGGKGISVASGTNAFGTSSVYTITAITRAASAVFTMNTVSASNPMLIAQIVNFSGVVGMTEINSLTGTITAIGGVSGAWTATVDIVSTNFTAYASGGSANVANPHRFIKIIDNEIVGVKVSSGSTSPGISVQYATDVEIQNNTLDGTTITLAPDAGISALFCVKLGIDGNRVRNFTGGYGIQALDCHDFDIGRNFLYNNQNQCNTAANYGICWLHDNYADTTTNSVETNTAFTGVRSWGNAWDYTQVMTTVTVTYSASMTFDASSGNRFVITATNGTAFTINAPTNPPAYGSGRFTVTIRNSSGGALGAITWNAAFKLNATALAAATGNSRSIDFEWDGSNWIEVARITADVPN